MAAPAWTDFPLRSGETHPAVLDGYPADVARRLRGRFIVQPAGMREASLIEVPIDEVGAEWDAATGDLNSRGTFESVLTIIPGLKVQNFTGVYMMGALERPSDDPNPSPFSVADREIPANILGGKSAFRNLCAEMKRLGLCPIIDGIDRVSRTRMSRKYRHLTVETLSNKGIPLRHPGTDGRENQWEDTALLNHRRVETWNLMVAEVKAMAEEYGVGGIRLDNAQSLPPIMAPNMDELLRHDPDGEPHYSLSEVFYGAVVKANEEYGYWTSSAGIERGYPNPFLVKFCREMWNAFPDFIVMAEAHFHREAQLLTSGPVVHTVRIPQILASISGKSLRKDGTVGRVPGKNRSTARTLSRLYRNDSDWLPKNAIMVNCTCTHSSPYPGLLYGRRSWIAVDLLNFLPEVPMTVYGEERGRAYRMNMNGVSNTEEMTEYDVNFDAVLPKSPPLRTGQTMPSKPKGLPPLTPPHSVERKLKMKRKGSLADLRRVPSNSNLVRSRSRDDMNGMSVRSVSAADFRKMSAMEEQTRQEIGPASGYDIAQIEGHYSHRRMLRQELAALHSGFMCVLTIEPQLKEQVFAFARYTEDQVVIVAANFKDNRDGPQYSNGCDVELDFQTLWDVLPDTFTTGAAPCAFYSVVNTFTGKEHSTDVQTLEELVFRKYKTHLDPLGISLLTFKPVQDTPERRGAHFSECINRLRSQEANDIKDARENDIIARLARGAAASASDFVGAMESLRNGLRNEGCEKAEMERIMQLCMQRASQLRFMVAYEGVPRPKDFEPPAAEHIVAYLTHMSTCAKDPDLMTLARSVVAKTTKLGPLVFLTAELGRFSTAGGLGVMVDELTKGLAGLGLEVYVVSPYYTVNRKNRSGYLGDNIQWTRNISVNIGTHIVEAGVFEGVENDVNLIFLERGDFFPKVYADPGGSVRHLQTVVLMSLGSLEVCCQKQLYPSVIVTNDWLPSMAAGYRDFFGDYFKNTSFFHLIHNLGEGAYEGRVYPNPGEGTLDHIHRLPTHVMVNPWWSTLVVNPSRCAIMRSESWGTVSPSYLRELRAGHPLSDLLQQAKSPFAYPNGIRKAEREEALRVKGAESHAAAKEILQKRYFGFQKGDPTIPLFAFVGRITSQKGVHLILNAVDELIGHTNGKIQILVGGPANYSDEYSSGCARHMVDLRRRHPWCFWAQPDEFFTDGPMCNLGADFGLMPSLFEPGGIVQQEFFVAGTPVIAYKTGGLKDTVHEWKSSQGEGNGFTFEEYSHADFVWAVKRALRVFAQPHEYEEMRVAAAETTIDVSQVAWAWSSEFHRIRNAMYTRGDVVASIISSTVDEETDLYDRSANPVLIQWTGSGNSVVLKGSFDNWTAEWPLSQAVGDHGAFGLKLLLRPGEYVCKFKVNQEWTVADDLPQKQDEAGFTNNVLQVQ
ncbi:Starch synthase [Chondrus crispus]|uniref:Starch synthase n=1 Tax=Chondrus crispus TaxID=2769 RepID=R7QIX8_CHOCR|nr:Starch synthase [Chondrus crispus]CDF38462.1 Starch synthase [Chondrus crispus]|eukprot:XP_005718355.1 Starch synthase [Chondrus crispus]